MIKKAVIILTALLLISGCGYRMVLTGMKAAFKIYPESIVNNTSDLETGARFESGINMYLASINALADKADADYLASFALDKVKFSGSSNSTSNTAANVYISVAINIKDKQGKNIYSRTLAATENYTNTSSMSETTTNRNDAINDAISKIMTDFRNGFERK